MTQVSQLPHDIAVRRDAHCYNSTSSDPTKRPGCEKLD
jgi:hypothetical protein